MAPAREVRVYADGEHRTIGLHQREDLTPGSTLRGPAIVTQEDTTFAIPRGARARVDRFHNLHLMFTGDADV